MSPYREPAEGLGEVAGCRARRDVRLCSLAEQPNAVWKGSLFSPVVRNLETGGGTVLQLTCRLLVVVVGLAIVSGCGNSDESAGEVRESAKATATVTITATPAKSPPATSPRGFAALVKFDHEYGTETIRNIARVICEEVRTGDRSRSFPWRQMIGYAGERTVGAFIAYSVARHCPEEGYGLINTD